METSLLISNLERDRDFEVDNEGSISYCARHRRQQTSGSRRTCLKTV